jgi:hypothetical protein
MVGCALCLKTSGTARHEGKYNGDGNHHRKRESAVCSKFLGEGSHINSEH